jgi:hypothetical protein
MRRERVDPVGNPLRAAEEYTTEKNLAMPRE